MVTNWAFLSMYNHFLPAGLKGLRWFPACYKFLDNLLKSESNLGLKKNEKGSPDPGVLPRRLH